MNPIAGLSLLVRNFPFVGIVFHVFDDKSYKKISYVDTAVVLLALNANFFLLDSSIFSAGGGAE
jgi:hypothetical protein